MTASQYQSVWAALHRYARSICRFTQRPRRQSSLTSSTTLASSSAPHAPQTVASYLAALADPRGSTSACLSVAGPGIFCAAISTCPDPPAGRGRCTVPASGARIAFLSGVWRAGVGRLLVRKSFFAFSRYELESFPSLRNGAAPGLARVLPRRDSSFPHPISPIPR